MDDPPFMPLLTELGGSGDRHCYKHAAPNGAINALCATASSRNTTHSSLSAKQEFSPVSSLRRNGLKARWAHRLRACVPSAIQHQKKFKK